MSRKKGLLVSPRFPADSFWSYRHIMRYVGRRAAFPPLGLSTGPRGWPNCWKRPAPRKTMVSPNAVKGIRYSRK